MPWRMCECMYVHCFCLWLGSCLSTCACVCLCVGVQDSFVVVFSLTSGCVLYASEQAPSILYCKRKFLESAKFVELLFHQDVNVFYSHTAQPHLPPWSNSHTGLYHIYFIFKKGRLRFISTSSSNILTQNILNHWLLYSAVLKKIYSLILNWFS